MRRCVALAACIGLVSCCGRPSEHIEVMLPPWFSPDASHPSILRVFDEYREHYPGLTLRFGPGKANLLLEKLLLMAKEGHLPDIIMFKTAWTGDLASRGVLKPLPPALAEAVTDRCLGLLLPVVSGDGHVWAMPYDMDVRLIHYRADLVDSTRLPAPRMGWTFDEFAGMARALTRDIDGDGSIDVWGFAAPGARSQSTVAQFLPWAYALGAQLPLGSRWVVDQPAIAGALGIYAALVDSLRVAPADLCALEQADVYQGVVSGRFAMAEGGSWEISMLRESGAHGPSIRQAPLPTIDGADPVSSTDGWAFGLTTADRMRAAKAMPLLEALLSEQHQREKLLDHGWLPTITQGLHWVDEELGTAVSLSLRGCRSVPGGKGWALTSSALIDALHEVLVGKAGPEQALKNAQRRLEMLAP